MAAADSPRDETRRASASVPSWNRTWSSVDSGSCRTRTMRAVPRRSAPVRRSWLTSSKAKVVLIRHSLCFGLRCAIPRRRPQRSLRRPSVGCSCSFGVSLRRSFHTGETISSFPRPRGTSLWTILCPLASFRPASWVTTLRVSPCVPPYRRGFYFGGNLMPPSTRTVSAFM